MELCEFCLKYAACSLFIASCECIVNVCLEHDKYPIALHGEKCPKGKEQKMVLCDVCPEAALDGWYGTLVANPCGCKVRVCKEHGLAKMPFQDQPIIDRLHAKKCHKKKREMINLTDDQIITNLVEYLAYCNTNYPSSNLKGLEDAIKEISKRFTVSSSSGDPHMDAMLKRCFKNLKVKGADYTQGSSDRLINFKRAAEEYNLTPMQAWGIFWSKHVSAIKNYIKTGGQSESEPIEERVGDAMTYLMLFCIMVAEQKAVKP